MAMDVEARPSPDTNSVKQFGLKNTIQTNFGDDYVFQIIPKYVIGFCSCYFHRSWLKNKLCNFVCSFNWKFNYFCETWVIIFSFWVA